MDEPTYLVRFGSMSFVRPFRADATVYDRGQTVLIHSSRGTELGEVLARSTLAATPVPGASRILRVAEPLDLERARRARLDRPRRLDLCHRIFQEGIWPFTVIDVEPLLDDGRTVLYYLGPHHLDSTGLLHVFKETHALDLVLEPVGREEPPDDALQGGPGCGTAGCEGGCGASAHGCTGSALKGRCS